MYMYMYINFRIQQTLGHKHISLYTVQPAISFATLHIK